MTYQEMVAKIPRLSVQERLALLELISRSLRDELAQPAAAPTEDAEAIVKRLYRILKTEAPLPNTGSSLSRILGIAKPDGPPPTDEEIKEAYTDYLIEKYS